jgi:hypothetical protein
MTASLSLNTREAVNVFMDFQLQEFSSLTFVYFVDRFANWQGNELELGTQVGFSIN